MNERGMVLISVLWVVLILSLISFSLASAVRAEMNESQTTFDSDRAFFMARGAAEVVYRSFVNKQELTESSRLTRVNDEYVFSFDLGEARVRFESGSDRIDLNKASDVLIASMLDSLGLSEQTRNQLVDSILDWRDADDIPHLNGAEVREYGPLDTTSGPRFPRNGPFVTVDELLFVKNVTPDLFYGFLRRDPATNNFQRVSGLRDLVTVQSFDGKVNPNNASPAVLAALPRMTDEFVNLIVSERNEMPFANLEDMTNRVPAMGGHDSLTYLTFENQAPSLITARATVTSGISRTVRMLFSQEEKVQVLSYAPFIYRRVNAVQFNRWQYE